MIYRVYLSDRPAPVTIRGVRTVHADIGSYELRDIAGQTVAKFDAGYVQGWSIEPEIPPMSSITYDTLLADLDEKPVL